MKASKASTSQPTPISDIEAAQGIISSRVGQPQVLHDLAGRLIRGNRFTLASQVLEIAEQKTEPPDLLWFEISRKLALSTYKDQDRPLADRLKSAETRLLKLLKYQELPSKQRQDALGILGGINKQRWRVFGNRMHLEASLHWYLAGNSVGMAQDGGYTALNAAFVMDGLADTDRSENGTLSETAQARRAEATKLRDQILRTIPKHPPEDWGDEWKWWHYCTRGEAFLGLREYAEAKSAILMAVGLEIDNWQREATARQLADLINMHRTGDAPDVNSEAALDVLACLLGSTAQDPDSRSRAQEAAKLFVAGKIGLALSGGGFRASLFHVGVLARLAELDVLRHVEVISCVSGGSIIGAHYYLKLQALLETRDDNLRREDYIRLVREIEEEFLEGVQRNIRNLMLFGFRSNLKVLTSSVSSMTHRLGELYERELYARVRDGRERAPRLLQDLKIAPGGNRDFVPKGENWKRRCKVPILILNATTLNTCHAWQFTATFMGEPPTRSVNTEINANDRLRRMYHDEAPLAYRGTMRLGYAVAASACVPGLFDPLVLDNLYEERYVTRLVDGGVYDNQGLASLLEQDCTILLVSDASGQTGRQLEPADSRFGVLTRTQNVLMARVREAQYELLSTLSSSSMLRGVMYLHLKRGLEPKSVDWDKCPNPSKVPDSRPLTSYGIRRDVQLRLASVRTDLDAFSNVEADTLMLSGYNMTAEQFDSCIRKVPTSPEPAVKWRFQSIATIACQNREEAGLTELLRALDVAGRLAAKPFAISPRLRWATVLFLLVVSGCVLYGVWNAQLAIQLTLTRTHLLVLAVVVLLGVGIMAAGRVAARLLRYRNKPQRIAFAFLMCAGGWLIVRLYSKIVEPLYVRGGPKYLRVSPDLPVSEKPAPADIGA